MKDIRKILCPTDFSAHSSAATDLAADLARTFGAKIRLLYVFQPPHHLGLEEIPVSSYTTGSDVVALRRHASEAMEMLERKLVERDVQVERIEVDGVPYEKIAEQSRDVDLIVMGTHGHTGLPR